MNKILDATCSAAGVVSAEGVTVPAAEVLSEGNSASEGLLLIERDKARYLPSSASDIKALIIQMVAITDKLIVIATGLDGATGNTQAANIALLTVLKVQLDASKGTLK